MDITAKKGYVVIKASPAEADDLANRMQETSLYKMPSWADKLDLAISAAKEYRKGDEVEVEVSSRLYRKALLAALQVIDEYAHLIDCPAGEAIAERCTCEFASKLELLRELPT